MNALSDEIGRDRLPAMRTRSTFGEIAELLRQRHLILDGGMGTMIQSYKLEEEDFRNPSLST